MRFLRKEMLWRLQGRDQSLAFEGGRRMTNYEKIKAMSVEEMAEFLNKGANCVVCKCWDYCLGDGSCDCLKGITKYLESEVEEDG